MLELWAGAECTVNRVGDRYGDQLERGGHAHRDDDVDRLAALGATAVRQAVLWERVAPNGLASADWSWADRRLERLRALGVRPIVTLLHHGSGPRDTSLLDAAFAERLGEFAHAAARRYPWVEDWTPVNEPLTTARFSALYGLWYPHARDDRAFVRALVNQLSGVRAAMRAVRDVVPNARLVQTEDLGRTHAVPSLAYQASFENERRWLTFDVLAGRLRVTSRMGRYLRKYGIAAAELQSFVDAPCPPDVLGVNHYLTSERFLDRRVSRYPAHARGGNRRHRYADVEAVRTLAAGPAGPQVLIREAWDRYGSPIAVTECHLGCTREQQMRWLAEVWHAATALRDDGVDVRAVTAWSAFGAFDWASLLTRDEGVYEAGAFDVRAPAPRPTALAHMMRDLATRGTHDHPALDGPGWWATPGRLTYPPAGAARHRAADAPNGSADRPPRAAPNALPRAPRPILVTGAHDPLGRALTRACEARGLAYRALAHDALDVADDAAVADALGGVRPWAVVNAAGFSRANAVEESHDARWRTTVCGALALARACRAARTRLVTFSSAVVFDGDAERPYVEGDDVAPRNARGHAHAAAERNVLDSEADALVVRAGALFGADVAGASGGGAHDVVTRALVRLAAGESVNALADVTVSPTYAPAFADAVLDLLIDGERGLWHVANRGAMTWHALVRHAASEVRVDTATLRAVTLDDAEVPRQSALSSERGWPLDSVENAICQFAAHARPFLSC